MFETGNERAGVEELYQSAVNTSDLTVDVNRRGAADVLIAAGWSKSRLGQALQRLRSEWDGCSKPRKATDAEVAQFALEMPDRKGKPDIKRARGMADLGYSQAIKRRAEKIRGRSEVMEALELWAAAHGVDAGLLGPALTHWIAPTCPVCDGLGERRLPDAPVLGKTCQHCNGTGERPRPLGANRVLNFLKGAVGKTRHSMRNSLRNG
jgi:hypothetical protein